MRVNLIIKFLAAYFWEVDILWVCWSLSMVKVIQWNILFMQFRSIDEFSSLMTTSISIYVFLTGDKKVHKLIIHEKLIPRRNYTSCATNCDFKCFCHVNSHLMCKMTTMLHFFFFVKPANNCCLHSVSGLFLN